VVEHNRKTESQKTTPKVAPFSRRAIAHICDLFLVATILILVAQFLPVSPPPADAMAFYTAQDFKNYFTLVGVAIFIASTMYLSLILGLVHATPGMLLARLEYSGLNGEPASVGSYWKRLLRGLIYTLAIFFPGPLIALIVVIISYHVFNATVTTAAEMLDVLGVPSYVQFAIHALSFIALFIGLIYVIKQLNHRSKKTVELKPSWFDMKSGSTIVVKNRQNKSDRQ